MLDFGGWTGEDWLLEEAGFDFGSARELGSDFVGLAFKLIYARNSVLLIHESTSISFPLIVIFDPGSNGAEKAVRPILFPPLLNRVAYPSLIASTPSSVQVLFFLFVGRRHRIE